MNISRPNATSVLGLGVTFVALVPLIVTPELASPYVTGKVYYFRAIVAMTAALWAGLAVMRPSLRPRLTPLLWSWVALVGLVALANLRNLDLQTALWGSFERGDGFVTLFWVFVYFLVASVVMRQGVSRRRVLGAWVFSMTTVSVLATSQYGFALLRGHLDFRASGPLGNAGYLASCLVLSLFMVVGLYAETRRPAMRRLLVAAGWLQLFALLLASSRGAFAGLAVGFAAPRCCSELSFWDRRCWARSMLSGHCLSRRKPSTLRGALSRGSPRRPEANSVCVSIASLPRPSSRPRSPATGRAASTLSSIRTGIRDWSTGADSTSRTASR